VSTPDQVRGRLSLENALGRPIYNCVYKGLSLTDRI
jgi:hypothetical protein